jgi:diguanylate cyclase (GGDEF)-like protein
MQRSLATFFERRSKFTIGAFAVVLTIGLGYLDSVTGVEIHFLLLYLIPIFLGSWFVSLELGMYLAMFGSLVWFVADFLSGRSYTHAWIAFWNLLMRTGVFLTFAFIQAQLRAKLDEVSKIASRDLLTGLPNGRAFYQLVAGEIKRALSIEPMALASVDVGGLQMVNDRFGYPVGDQMLCRIAQTIKQTVPRPDLVGRIGGTSFSILLPNTTSQSANVILQNMREALQAERRKYSHPLTFSVSAVACAKSPKTIAALLHQADRRIDRVKGGKKDTIQIAAIEDQPLLN